MSDQASTLWLARGTIPSIPVDYTTVPVAELVAACTRDDAAAWREFIRRFHRIIAITAFRVARRWGENSPEVIDDLAQETYLKLYSDRARVLRECRFEHPEAILGFLKVVTANVTNDHFKRLHALKRGGDQATGQLEDSEGRAAAEGPAGLTPAEHAVMVDQVDACLRATAPPETCERDRTIFWLYYRQGMTAKEIAGLASIGLSLKGVESTLHRLTQLVRTHLVEARSRKMGAPQKGTGPGIRH